MVQFQGMISKLGMVFLVLVLSLVFLSLPINADEIEDLQKQIDELAKARELSVKATKPLEGQLSSLKRQLAQIQSQLDNLSAKISQKEKALELREERVVRQQALLEVRVRSYYIRSFLASPFLVILSSAHPGDLFRELAFRQNESIKDRQFIISITEEIKDLLTQKEKLEKDKQSLALLQSQVDKNATFLGGEVSKAKAYQAELSSKIAQLSAKQQQIIAQKLGSLNLPTSLGAGPLFCTDDRNLNPGFSPAFAFFTFGIPHRVGMNQYGAYGRAKIGQSHEDILRAYFDNFSFETKSNINISVQGYGGMPLETYLLGIYEMPDSFPMEALKAQAIAARSYALSYTDSGSKEICTSQSCQVYKGGNKGGNWEQAVKATEGKTMISGGQAITAWYSSTDGGYTYSSSDVGWSSRPWTKRTKDTSGEVGSFADLSSKAYDKDSPCFYAAQGYRNEYGKSAWLKSSELADIVNVILLTRADGGTKEHLYQVDKPNPAGTDTWDGEKVKSELRSRGGTPFSSISDMSISADFSSGMVSSINVSGDGGNISFNGTEFKNFFNLRAPANIQIVGPLYNMERK
ncbi:SpoIID/LytB domain-containing protein [Candidatus Daviesbacteria bacterium]|nr:SpoIID/LytB domain-containing protein [Candidatus Daviesbacteria bacterium]